MPSPDFLPLLSTVMSQSPEHSAENPLYDQLYLGLTRDLPALMEQHSYPDALSVVDDCNRFLEFAEIPLQYPEIVDRTVCHVSSSSVAHSIAFVAKQNNCEQILSLCNKDCPIPVPFLLSYGREPQLCAVNYVGCRIPLTEEQYALLVKGCQETGIALNRILRMFCLQLPELPKELTFLCDHIRGNSHAVFKPFINYSLCYRLRTGTSKAVSETPSKKTALYASYDGVFFPKLSEETRAQLEKESQCPVYTTAEFAQLIRKYHPSYFGFSEQLDGIVSPIIGYYSRKSKESKELLRLLEQDAVRTSNKLSAIGALQDTMSRKKDSFSKGHEAIMTLEKQLQEVANALSLTLQPANGLTRFVPHRVFNSIFIALFSTQAKGRSRYQWLYKKLESLGYENLPLASAYINRILTPDNMQSAPVALPACNPGELHSKILNSAAPAYWEQAKMMLLMCSAKELSFTYQKSFVLRIPKEHIDSGKLLYDMAMSTSGKETQEYLVKAVEAGYEPAMELLYNSVKSNPTASSLQPLINQLYPAACIQFANTFAATLPSSNFQNAMFYYKLAASAKSLEALDKIAELTYNLLVTPHITKSGLRHHNKIASICDQLIPICQHLVAEKYHTLDNNCRLGVMLCYRGKNPSAAAQALNGKTNALAQFCKADMYEHGKYYVKDLKKAKELYTASKTPAATAALQRVSKQIAKEEAAKEEAAAHSYSESETYSSSTYSSSSGGGFCFITTAACIALQGEDQCPELMLLRAFRDNSLRSSTEGEELVEEYYRIGPMIVQKLNALPNKQEEYLALWDKYIGPSCHLIQSQRLDEARNLYIAMVVALCRRFQIPVNTAGFPSLRESLQAQGLPMENL